MAYGSHGFYHFHLGVFHVKIVALLWLIYCFFVGFVVGLFFFVQPILTHKEGKVIFRIIVFGSLSQQIGIRNWIFGVFLCARMDDGMIKLNSLNYSTWKRMMEDFLYCKDLYKLIRLKEKPSDTLDEDWDVEHRKSIACIRRWMHPILHEHIYDETKVDVV